MSVTFYMSLFITFSIYILELTHFSIVMHKEQLNLLAKWKSSPQEPEFFLGLIFSLSLFSCCVVCDHYIFWAAIGLFRLFYPVSQLVHHCGAGQTNYWLQTLQWQTSHLGIIWQIETFNSEATLETICLNDWVSFIPNYKIFVQ